MHIAWTSFVLDCGRSGIATYIQSLLQALGRASDEHEYDVWLAKGAEQYLPPLSEHMHLCYSSPLMEPPLANILWHNTMLPWEACRQKYDLVHVPSIRRIPLIKGCPLVATVHDLAAFSMPDKYSWSRIFYHQQVLRRLIHRCDRVITVSNYTKDDIVRHTGYPQERIDVVYSGLDTTVFRPVDKEPALEYLCRQYGIDEPFMVYVSRVEHPAKNHIKLIQAFEKFKKLYDSHYTLVLAGPDWTGADEVKRYAEVSPVKEQIRFLGSVPREDIIRLYSTCDFMAFPSLFEGFGFPLLEGLACGARVICSERTSLAELAKGYAETFNPDSIDDILAKIVSAAEQERDEEKVQRGIAYARSFQWDTAAKQVLQIYEKCAGKECSV